VELSGNAATAAQGTVVPGITVALTGNGVIASVGTISPAIALALSGLAGTSSAGIVVPGLSLALSGNAGTSAVGSVIPSGGNINVALSGNQATTAVGLLSVLGASIVAVSTRRRGILAAKRQADTKRVTFDFISQLSSTEALVSATTALSIYSGDDPLALLAWIGSPAVSQTRVTQFIEGGVVGCTYQLTCHGVVDSGKRAFTNSFLSVL
jgi:hypothetical protein